mgnify:CR=1 FL=1
MRGGIVVYISTPPHTEKVKNKSVRSTQNFLLSSLNEEIRNHLSHRLNLCDGPTPTFFSPSNRAFSPPPTFQTYTTRQKKLCCETPANLPWNLKEITPCKNQREGEYQRPSINIHDLSSMTNQKNPTFLPWNSGSRGINKLLDQRGQMGCATSIQNINNHQVFAQFVWLKSSRNYPQVHHVVTLLLPRLILLVPLLPCHPCRRLIIPLALLLVLPPCIAIIIEWPRMEEGCPPSVCLEVVEMCSPRVDQWLLSQEGEMQARLLLWIMARKRVAFGRNCYGQEARGLMRVWFIQGPWREFIDGHTIFLDSLYHFLKKIFCRFWMYSVQTWISQFRYFFSFLFTTGDRVNT